MVVHGSSLAEAADFAKGVAAGAGTTVHVQTLLTPPHDDPLVIAGQATALASITTMSAMSAALATGTILMAVPGVSNSSAHDAMHCNLRRWRAAGDARDAVESQLRTVGKQAGR